MIKKARIIQERQTYTGAFDDFKRRKMYQWTLKSKTTCHMPGEYFFIFL